MTFLFAKKGDVHHRIDIDDILYLKAEEQYTVIFLSQNKYLVKGSLKNWIEKIDKFLLRVHGSYAINKSRITSVRMSENIILVDDHKIPIGRSYKTELIVMLKEIH